jgi:hypothetical protein
MISNFRYPKKSGQLFCLRRNKAGCKRRGKAYFLFGFFFWVFLVCLPAAGEAGKTSADDFETVIKTFVAFGDRTTGTPGAKSAAGYIKERFNRLGLESVNSHWFSVPVVHHGKSTLTVIDQNVSFPIRPINANAITPQTVSPPGLEGPLIYVGQGELHHLNGKRIDGAIVLMELDSGKNWLLSPIQFPRFWMPISGVRNHFGSFESNPGGIVATRIRLSSEAGWHEAIGENIYALIPGSDSRLAEELIIVEAFYDSSAIVSGLSPGADEACSVTTLLKLSEYLKKTPPKRSVLLLATSGHAQSLAGMRELIWSISARSKDMRTIKKVLQAAISKSRKTIKALANPHFEGAEKAESSDSDTERLLKEALGERVKTEADEVSRRLMRLRLQQEKATQQDLIQDLAQQRLLLRRLIWRKTFTDVPKEERQILYRLVPDALRDQKAILAEAREKLRQLDSARAFRKLVKNHEVSAAISLHLSSHGDGFGAFNYGWLYPFRPRINRTAAYSKLNEVLREAAAVAVQKQGFSGIYKDTLRPSRRRSWQSYFLDRPPLGGEISALAGMHGLSFVTTHDARPRWGTPYDIPENVNISYALKQGGIVCDLVHYLAKAPELHSDIFPRNGFSAITGRAKFLRQGELFADQPAPGTVLLAYQGPTRYHVMVGPMGTFDLRGVADKKHSYHKVIIEGYKFDPNTGSVIWAIDKKQTGKAAYRVKMRRRFMETDLVMFACHGTTLFSLLEPRTYRYMTKTNVIDGRREADPLRWFMSRLDTWSSNISTVFLEPGTPLKLTLSDTILRNKLVLTNPTESKSEGIGYMVDQWPMLHRTEYTVARDMWALLEPRIANLERRGIFNERIRSLQEQGTTALKAATQALSNNVYDRFSEASARSWALASRVYDDVEKTQKDVLYGVLFYIALFVPFSFCMERLIFSFSNIYKRIIAFCTILLLLIILIYEVHPAFKLAYSPMVVILAFFIMGLSLMVTLIIFFRFEEEMTGLQTRAQLVQAGEIGRWKAFVAAFLLGVSNLKRRRLRTVLTCTTLIILTFTIMSFTSVKSMRQHTRILYQTNVPYQGFLLKNVNWRDLPPEALGFISNAFAGKGTAVPRVWLENEDKTRAPSIPVRLQDQVFEAQGMVGLSHQEGIVSGLDKILIGGRWFAENELHVALLPERMASNLGIDPYRPQGAVVQLWGIPFRVVGTFSGKQFQEHNDLDGEPLTPAIFPHEITTEMTEVEAEALESGEDVKDFQSRYQHLPGELTLIIPHRTLLALGGHLKGVAIRPRSQASKQTAARDLVDRFGLSLFSGEPAGTFLYNASDTMSYSGVPNILIPLVISIFIVLNTMISSVYERKREIGIYTSVGLAPSHVSFLFIAEAMALAVLSVVLGYLLAQTAAKLFAETSLWSGITVNYSSLAGVAAMILVIIVVLISVLYPSKVAGEIAIPDVNRSWTLPEAKGNVLELTLPFLMKVKEHRSVGGYLLDYFKGHQDVTHGQFSTGTIDFGFVCQVPPSTENDTDCSEDDCEIPACLELEIGIWLAPFDFGIMQKVDFQFQPAQEGAGFLEIYVRLTRKSGEANAWRRINRNFLHQIRKQLLIWRSFDEQEKKRYQRLLAELSEQFGIDPDAKQ